MLKRLGKTLVFLMLAVAAPAFGAFDSQDQMLKSLFDAGAENVIAFDDGVVNTRVWNANLQKITKGNLAAIFSETDHDVPALDYYNNELFGRRLWKARQFGEAMICYTPERNALEQVLAHNLDKNVYAPCFLIVGKTQSILDKVR